MSIFGILAATASLTVIIIGLPSQIIKNYRRKSCEGLAPSLIYSAFSTYALWAAYGWSKLDWFMIVSQTPGSLISLILICQMFLYRKRRKQE